MDHPSLVALVSVLATLAAVGTLGATALLVGAYTNQRARLQAAERQAAEYARQLAEQARELKDYRKARRSKLYRGALQEYGFAARQTIVRLRALKAEFDEEFDVIEKMLDLSQKE